MGGGESTFGGFVVGGNNFAVCSRDSSLTVQVTHFKDFHTSFVFLFYCVINSNCIRE